MPQEKNSQYLDSLLLQELQQNKEKALSFLFSEHYNKLYRTGLRLSHDHNLTEEAIQEVFLDLWKYRHTLSEIQSFEAYLVSSVKKRVSRKLGNADQTSSLDLSSIALSVDSYEEILMMQEADDDRKKIVQKALQSLNPKQKEIITLKYFEELSYKEIADKTGLQVDYIYKILHDGIKSLKSIIETNA